MNQEANKERQIFAEAIELPSQRRGTFLKEACEADGELLKRVQELLDAYSDESPVLRTVRDTLPEVQKISEGPGTKIGRYKLLQKIGEGGMGAVYMAEQEEPVRRRVALKIIKVGMDTKQVIARFEAERQALALMDHPNIARVLDGGATETGRPYFVMELVRGTKITQYCDDARLSTRERLDLFIQVCQAIQHAHQKGIIHRDIKPSNILITINDGVAVPKVIDFGIAKATNQQQLTDKTLFTAFEQFIGTPAYMSPEQAVLTSVDIDTRSDIYSLGVLLYEMLTGKTPFDANELLASGLDEMRKTIREKEPVRPSTRLSIMLEGELTTTAKHRQSDAPKLVNLLRGDVDWIVMKCLEKDRQRRYETANGLAADLKRHLNHEPVTARPPSAAYRFQKLLRRNKVMSAATALVLTAILAGTAVSITQTLRARRELRRALAAESQAQKEKANAQAALHFIQDDVLSQASPGYQPDRELTVRALIDRIAGRLDQPSRRPPLVEASIRQTLGSVYAELGDYPKAAQHYEGALRLQREHLGDSHPDTLRTLYGLSVARWWNGDIAQARPLTRQGLETSRRVLGEKDPLTLQFMEAHAIVLMFMGEMPWTELEPFFLQVLALHRENQDEVRTLKLIEGLSEGYTLHWQPAKAEPLTVDALARSQRALGPDHPDTGRTIITLGWIYEQLNQPEKAKELILRSLELRRRVLGEDSPRTLSSFLLLTRVYVQQQQFDEAGPRTDEVLARIRSRPGVLNDLYLPYQVGELGWAYLEQGHLAIADTLCDLALQAMRRKTDASPVVLARVLTHMGAVRLAQERYSEAETLLRESSLLAEKLWPDTAFPFHVKSLLGASLTGQKKYPDAELLLQQGYDGLVRHQTNLPPYFNPMRRVKESLDRLVQLYDAWGKPAQAAAWKKKLDQFQQTPKATTQEKAENKHR
jgi:serine/threonine protein kinase